MEGVVGRGSRTLRATPARLAAALLALLVLAPGCQIGYLARAGIGQAGVLLSRRPVAEVLASGELSEEEARKLRLVGEARRYAFERIGLDRSGSYTSFYDTGGKPVAYNVQACAKDRFAQVSWWFPIVGSITYKGYFTEGEAKAEAARLAEDGFDTLVSPVAGYSTLGWFDDPILSSMLRYQDEDLVDLIIHELTHGTVYVPSNVTFNENLATFVGYRGAIDFFTERDGRDSDAVKRAKLARRDSVLFSRFVDELHGELEELYASGRPSEELLVAREEVFAAGKRRFAELQKEMSPGAYGAIAKRPLNNASVLAYRAYVRELESFEAVWRASGENLRRTVSVFRELRDSDDPEADLERLAAEGRPPPDEDG